MSVPSCCCALVSPALCDPLAVCGAGVPAMGKGLACARAEANLENGEGSGSETMGFAGSLGSFGGCFISWIFPEAAAAAAEVLCLHS